MRPNAPEPAAPAVLPAEEEGAVEVRGRGAPPATRGGASPGWTDGRGHPPAPTPFP